MGSTTLRGHGQNTDKGDRNTGNGNGWWTLRASDALVALLVACAIAILAWGFGEVAHYARLDEQRRDILCERGLRLLASPDPANVARGDTIVRKEACSILLNPTGTIPASTAKLDAFLANNPDGLDDLMAIKRRDRSYAGPEHADPFLWTIGSMVLGVLLIVWIMLRWHGLLYDREGKPR